MAFSLASSNDNNNNNSNNNIINNNINNINGRQMMMRHATNADAFKPDSAPLVRESFLDHANTSILMDEMKVIELKYLN